MEWEGREESENVEDRRGIGGRTAAIGGGSAAVLVVVVLIANFLGVDPEKAVDIAKKVIPPDKQGQGDGTIRPAPVSPHEKRNETFTRIILKDTELVWSDQFRKIGKRYVDPKLVFFSGTVNSACGSAEASMGPFYCPGDEEVYIDLSFYDELEQKLQSPGDFAKAYVVAHEVGHHVQKQLGYSARVNEVRRKGNELESKHASVRLELQADFLAGVWGHYAKEKFKIQQSDVESAMNAAKQIGDDMLQKRFNRGRVVEDMFTHGSSAQRMRWFMEGFRTGDLQEARQLFDLPYNQL